MASSQCGAWARYLVTLWICSSESAPWFSKDAGVCSEENYTAPLPLSSVDVSIAQKILSQFYKSSEIP